VTIKPAATRHPSAEVLRETLAPRALVDLSRPGALEELNEVASDWLFEHCGDAGRRKLLAEHDLLAA
jgi:hypothetical protein